MKILKENFFFFLRLGIFLFKLEKSHLNPTLERGGISAPEDTKKNSLMQKKIGGRGGGRGRLVARLGVVGDVQYLGC